MAQTRFLRLRFGMSSSFRPGEYLLAMEGLAILRAWGTDAALVHERAAEIASIIGKLDTEPSGATSLVPEYDVEAGYDAWAPGYDGMPNVVIDVEERVLHPLLDTLPPGRALDAACGTGRHAARLAARGHEVVG